MSIDAYKTPDFVRRKGIVLSREQVPYDSALTFNAGISRHRDGYVMLFRNDYGFCKQDCADFYAGISDNTTPKTNLGAAYSKDGMNWEVISESVFSLSSNGISRVYDPRITDFGNGQYGVCFAIDSNAGVRILDSPAICGLVKKSSLQQLVVNGLLMGRRPSF